MVLGETVEEREGVKVHASSVYRIVRAEGSIHWWIHVWKRRQVICRHEVTSCDMVPTIIFGDGGRIWTGPHIVGSKAIGNNVEASLQQRACHHAMLQRPEECLHLPSGFCVTSLNVVGHD